MVAFYPYSGFNLTFKLYIFCFKKCKIVTKVFNKLGKIQLLYGVFFTSPFNS